MSGDSNRAVKKNSPPTLWEHFVMHKASEKKVMLFDLEIEDGKRINANHNKKRKMSALDAATAVSMKERGRSVSAPANFTMAKIQGPKLMDKQAEERLLNSSLRKKYTTSHKALSPITSIPPSPSPSPTSDSQLATSYDSVFRGSHHHIKFGPEQLRNLPPLIQAVDTELQECLINSRPIERLTMQRRFESDQHDELLMMSGALDVEDGGCEVCAARDRAMNGLEEAGIVSL